MLQNINSEVQCNLQLTTQLTISSPEDLTLVLLSCVPLLLFRDEPSILLVVPEVY